MGNSWSDREHIEGVTVFMQLFAPGLHSIRAFAFDDVDRPMYFGKGESVFESLAP